MTLMIIKALMLAKVVPQAAFTLQALRPNSLLFSVAALVIKCNPHQIPLWTCQVTRVRRWTITMMSHRACYERKQDVSQQGGYACVCGVILKALLLIRHGWHGWHGWLTCLLYLFFICCILPGHNNEVCHSFQLCYILMWLFRLRSLLNKLYPNQI